VSRTAVGLGALLLVLALDTFASIRVGRWEAVTSMQRAAWLLFIWAVPILGALLALQVTSETSGGPPTGQSSGAGIGDAFGLDVGSHSGDGGGHGGDGGGGH
jgi:hypothetical protein